MDSQDLERIALRVYSILDNEFDVIPYNVTLSLLVDEEFYDGIKDNFPDRHPSNLIIEEKKENWRVAILHFRPEV